MIPKNQTQSSPDASPAGQCGSLSVIAGSLISWMERRREIELQKKAHARAFNQPEAEVVHGCKARAYTETIDYAKQHGATVSIRLERNDAIPAFGAFLRCEEQHAGSHAIALNVQAVMAPEAEDDMGNPISLTREERKRLVITTLMHEFGHALESHFRLPVNEEAIEKACEGWERAYSANHRLDCTEK